MTMISKLTDKWPLFVIVAILIVGVTRDTLIRYDISVYEAAFKTRSWVLREPQFDPLGNYHDSKLRYATFTYQSLDGEIKYAEDCLGCDLKVGDVHVFHSYVSPEESEAIFDRYIAPPGSVPGDASEVIYEHTLANEQGESIGRRAFVKFNSYYGKEFVLFWTENGEFWSISSISDRHVNAFENSEHFDRIRTP